jgi:predicted transcriptional regulator
MVLEYDKYSQIRKSAREQIAKLLEYKATVPESDPETRALIDGIIRGEESLAAGRYSSHEDVMGRMMTKWLKPPQQ